MTEAVLSFLLVLFSPIQRTFFLEKCLLFNFLPACDAWTQLKGTVSRVRYINYVEKDRADATIHKCVASSALVIIYLHFPHHYY